MTWVDVCGRAAHQPSVFDFMLNYINVMTFPLLFSSEVSYKILTNLCRDCSNVIQNHSDSHSVNFKST
jgi:hypothetical protein